MFNKTHVSAVLLTSLGLTACVQSTSLSPSVAMSNGQTVPQSASGITEQVAPKASFNRFPDLPVPTSADMDVSKTQVFGSGEAWFGQLSLNSGHDSNALFDFYKQELPSSGWQEITSVRAQVSVLTYQRGERVLSIQIQPRTLNGATAILTVSPRGRATQ